MLSYTNRPLTPAARARMTGKGRDISPFRSTWTATSNLLDKELRALRAHDVILMVDVTEGEIRNDGKVRANARPSSPAVALAFESRTKGSLMFCCGRFRDWQDNVRAIALGLEALRRVERYGIISSDEQYTGFRAIAAESAAPEGWVNVFARHAGWTLQAVLNDPQGAYRAAVKATHPDQDGGSRVAFLEVQGAYEKSRRTAS